MIFDKLRLRTGGGLIVFFILLLALAITNKNNSFLQRKLHLNNKPSRTANIAIVSALAGAFILNLSHVYKRSSKFHAAFAKKYIIKAMEKYQSPNLAEYKSVLNNPCALNHLATAIINELTKTEQEEVFALFDGLNDFSTKEQIDKACDEIIKTIEYHDSVNPDFAGHLRAAMAHEDYLMYVKQKRTENTLLLKNQRTK